jgi:hypothetical protein
MQKEVDEINRSSGAGWLGIRVPIVKLATAIDRRYRR